MATLIVIPARWGSTRLPGKPLALINGKTLLNRVADIAAAAADRRSSTSVVIATDDRRIADHARSIGHEVAMTDPAIDCGTARALVVATGCTPRPTHVINLQGDSPFTAPETLLAIIDALDGGASVATPVIRLDWGALDRLRVHKETSPFSGTTCTRDATGRALWFSKQIIPAIRDEAARRSSTDLSPVFRHLGVYGYTIDALVRFCAATPSANERLEGLEQLRFLEMQIAVQTIVVPAQGMAMSGIDTAEDLAAARSLIDTHGEPAWA